MFPFEEQGVSTPSWAPQSGATVLGRGVHLTSCCKNQSICIGEIEGCWKPRHLLKGMAHKILVTGTYPGLQWRDGGSKWIRVIQGETEYFVVLGRRLEGQSPMSMFLVSPSLVPPTDAIFPGLSTLSILR